MIYIYDILTNFNDELIDFYDWIETDCLEHIRKIPMIKVTDTFYKQILNKQIRVSNEFLNKIKNKTEVFNDKSIEKIEYGTIISSKNDSFVCIFNKDGFVMELSKLLIDEEIEILEIAKGLEFYKLDYTIINKEINLNIFLRSEKRVINKILLNLKRLKELNKEELLKYLYYEWFLINPNTKNYYEKLIKDIKKEFTSKHKTFLDLINITQEVK